MTQRELPPHVTVPLLDRLTASALDADYQTVADRRLAAGEQSSRLGLAQLMVVLALFGLLVSTAFAQTRRDATVSANGRATLISQIAEQKAALTRLAAQEAVLRRSVSALRGQDSVLNKQGAAAQSLLQRLQTPSGFSAVHGPGLRALVTDGPPAADKSNLVRDSDLAFLVNGLWASGAEAIAINGQRLTSLSAIRNSGWAIHVNGRGLAAPYTVEVIGDPNQLQAKLLETTTGQLWFAIVRQVGFEFTMTSVKNLTLPAAPLRTPQSAEAIAAAGGKAQDSQGGTK